MPVPFDNRLYAQSVPDIRQKEGYEQQLWDHLAQCPNFRLDIDYPFEVIQPDSLESRPQPVFLIHATA